MHQPSAAPAAVLKLTKDNPALGLPDEEWSSALEHAAPDPVVGIRHAAIKGDISDRFHVASIPVRVGCHFHKVGDEDYAVVQGNGTMLFGQVLDPSGTPHVKEWQKLEVRPGDKFTIPAGFAHQLCADAGKQLVIVFRCPDSHLNDSADRTILPDSPLVPRSV
jgi:mannose-6-phosphate isomerase-like protein (cupin superfamily)